MPLSLTALAFKLPEHLVNDPEYIQQLRDRLDAEYGGDDAMPEPEDDSDE